MADRLYPNKYAGVCKTCRTKVDVNAGFIKRTENGRWITFCRSATCLEKSGIDVAEVRAEHERSMTRRLNADGTIEMRYDAEALPLLRAIPGAKFDRDTKRWQASMAQNDRPRLLEIADQLGLEVHPSLRMVSESADALAAAERARQCPTVRSYQIEGARWLADHPRALLGDEMGLGKTAQILWAASPGDGLLVICPAPVKMTWRREVERFRPDFDPKLLPGRNSLRWPDPNEVLIINYDILPPEPASILGQAPPHVRLVVDEAHRCKSHKSQRSAKVRGLADACKSVWLMTGTPLTDRPFDLYGVLNTARLAHPAFGGWFGFIRAFGGRKNHWGGYVFRGPDRSVPERLRNVMLRRLKENVLTELPPKQRDTLVLSRDTMGRSLLTSLDQEWEGWRGDYLPPLEALSTVREQLAVARIKPMLDFVADYEEQNEPLVVFSAHRAPIQVLKERDGWGVIMGDTPIPERQHVIDEFQEGRLIGVGCTIQAGGVGVTLTRAATVLFVDLDWTPANNAQAEDRIHRIGQAADVVRIITMVADHPLDKRVHELLTAKGKLIHESIDALVDYRLTDLPDAATLGLIEEDERAWAMRVHSMNPNIAEHARIRALGKIGSKVDGMRACGVVLPEMFTDEQSNYLRRAVQYLAERCDGAVEKDGQGFNKTDTAVGHWLAAAGIESLESLQVAWAITRKYGRQLSRMSDEE